ncbi:MAG: hypothetical protein O3A14_16315 [Cyanobacteria bacterium]|nr:hypothetical protein [Cyanobacteriota bacterium]
MVQRSPTITTLETFWASPQVNGRYELINGPIISQWAPKRCHSKTQRALLRLLEAWGDSKGEVGLNLTAQQVFQKAGLLG